jgi:hypothetical protein
VKIDGDVVTENILVEDIPLSFQPDGTATEAAHEKVRYT